VGEELEQRAERKQVPLRLPTEMYDRASARAATLGVSANAYIVSTIQEALQPGGAVIAKARAQRVITESFNRAIDTYGWRVDAKTLHAELVKKITEEGSSDEAGNTTTSRP
jgi:hypothetical protein